ncbi:hypothetical protein WV31_14455 [Magnetospirillum sp. ME-1]|uniref:metallophosphoesterase n=1 Tax=Magnetospirillum sp. ME-1 TaxID=1639348 RepID=UPI000A17F58A|nr:metallophosphoesterase [Magnetospirillum sp. ME-1]ARJ66787.1 hypothetical protein WV31_14455 [Magnetospirillum sp. ME-1]
MSDEHRLAWRERRKTLEQRYREHGRRTTFGGERRVESLPDLIRPLPMIMRLIGLEAKARRNAGGVRLTRLEFSFPDLPPAFDGYTILFLSDIHVGSVPQGIETAAAMAAGVPCDLALLGGDFQLFGKPSADMTANQMAPLLAAIKARDGVAAVLGNHDGYRMVEALEALGVRVLVNEVLGVSRGNETMSIVGCDDIHNFHTPAADAALKLTDGFRIALIHSPEFAGHAAAAGCSLYLAGHTHGGQICLPGGIPLFTATDGCRRLSRGTWRHAGMQGYTSTGLGAGHPPYRFNCPPEMALITLRRTP